MGDGPFGEPEAPKNQGRGTYGGGKNGVAPIINEGFGQKPKSSDPYFKPPENGQPGRGRPFLEPPNVPGVKPKPNDQQPGGQQPPPPEQGNPGQPAPQPGGGKPDGPVFNPNIRHKFGDEQPYRPQPEGDGTKSDRELRAARGSKSKMFIEARDLQRGSDLSLAVIGGTSASLAQPVEKATGWVAQKGAAMEGQSLFAKTGRGTGNFWLSNYNTEGIQTAKIAKEKAIVQSSFKAISETHALDKSILEKLAAKAPLAADEAKYLGQLKTALNITDESTLMKTLAERQVHFNPANLEKLGAAGTKDLITTIDAIQDSRGSLIMTKSEQALLSSRHAAQEAKALASSELELAKTEGKAFRWTGKSGLTGNLKTGFLGTLGTGVVISTDQYARDRMYGKDAASWESNNLSVPMAIAMAPKYHKLWAVPAAVAGGHLADRLPFTPHMPEAFKRFTAFDAAPLGVALAMPTKRNLSKAGLITLAYLGGNGLEMAFTGNSTGDVEQESLKTRDIDKAERSYDSMRNSIDDYKKLGKKNEPILEDNLARQLLDSNQNYSKMSQEDKLAAHRNTLALATSLGEYRLENGTRLKSQDPKEPPTYILKGLNMDMGAGALMYLQMARNSVGFSKQMTEVMVEKQAFGSKVRKEEVEDLNKIGNKVNADIQAILGKHDCQKVMDTLGAFLSRGTTNDGAVFDKENYFYETFVRSINKKIGENFPAMGKSPDAKVIVAKLLRDQALAQMALATHKLNHGDDAIGAGTLIFGTDQGRNMLIDGTGMRKGYDGAIDALRLAAELDKNNPDLPELIAICNSIGKDVQARKPDQYRKFDLLNVEGR